LILPRLAKPSSTSPLTWQSNRSAG
jgi:hypothetical protein